MSVGNTDFANGRIAIPVQCSTPKPRNPSLRDAGNTETIYVKAYTGLTGRIMNILGYAMPATIKDNDGKERDCFLNIRSLGKQALMSQGAEEKEITNKMKDIAAKNLLTQFPLQQGKSLDIGEVVDAYRNNLMAEGIDI